MTNVWCVRANYGKYTQQFRDKGCIATGWIYETDLGHVKAKEKPYLLHQMVHPTDRL